MNGMDRRQFGTALLAGALPRPAGLTLGLFRDRVGDWGEELRKGKAVLAIKPHRFGAMSLPEHAGWLIRQLRSPPWLRLVYDFSHYDLRGVTLEQTVRVAAPWTAFVAV